MSRELHHLEPSNGRHAVEERMVLVCIDSSLYLAIYGYGINVKDLDQGSGTS